MPMLMGPPNRACYKHTCRIQACLQENNFDPRACAWAVDALKQCCALPHAAHSIHCAFPDVQQRREEERREAEERERVRQEGERREAEEQARVRQQTERQSGGGGGGGGVT